MATQPWDCLWSGARFHVGLVGTDPLIDVDVLGHWRIDPEHGVSFELAASVFRDPRALSVFDIDHSEDEGRWITSEWQPPVSF
jgi:hypothetical protein